MKLSPAPTVVGCTRHGPRAPGTPRPARTPPPGAGRYGPSSIPPAPWERPAQPPLVLRSTLQLRSGGVDADSRRFLDSPDQLLPARTFRKKERPGGHTRAHDNSLLGAGSGAPGGSRNHGGPGAGAPAGGPERGAHRARRRGVRPDRLLRIGGRPRTSTGWPPAGCSSPTSNTLCARPPGPACSRGATTIRTAWVGSRTWPSATRNTTPASRSATGSSRNPGDPRLCACGGGEVARHARGRGPPGGAPPQLAHVPGLPALVRVPWGGDTPVRAHVVPGQPRHRGAPHSRLSPHRGPGRPRHQLPDRHPFGRT